MQIRIRVTIRYQGVPMVERVRTIEDLELLHYGYRGGYGDIRKADDNVLSNTSGYLNTIYGAQAWVEMNLEASWFSILPKYPWKRSGYRSITAAGTLAAVNNEYTALGGTAESGRIADTIKPTVTTTELRPKLLQVAFGASVISEWLANSSEDDSYGGMPQLRTFFSTIFRNNISTMISADAEKPASVANASYAGTFDLESIDRIVSAKAESDALKGNSSVDGFDPWDRVDRDTSTAKDSIVVSAGDSIGDNEVITKSKVREFLKEFMVASNHHPEVLVTGHDVYTAIQELYENHTRYVMGEHVVSVDINGVDTYNGRNVGLHVSSLFDVPLVMTQHDVKNSDDSDEVGRMFGLDLSDRDGFTDPRLGVMVAVPPTYQEIGRGSESWPFTLNSYTEQGLYWTLCETVCKRFSGQGKLRDIKL